MKKLYAWLGVVAMILAVFTGCEKAPPVNISERPLFDESAIKAEFQQVIAACDEIINGFAMAPRKSYYPAPTLEEFSRMSNAVGNLGYPVYYNDLDMPNHEKVEAFWSDVQAGNDAQITIYCLNNWAITADILVCRERELYRKSSIYYEYTGNGEISYNEAVEPIDDMRMTEKGYLLYRVPAHDEYDESHDGYRITPLGEEKRELGRKYIKGIGYYPNFMLRYDWNSNDFSALNLEWIFESLYNKFNGKFAYEVYTETDAEERLLIPSDAVEEIMLKRLPLTVEQLRTSIPFNEEKNAYAHIPFNGGGYAPRSEVVEIIKNEDGSLSLRIDAVAIEFGDDASMTNMLTVIDNSDGSFKYLSNYVVTPFV